MRFLPFTATILFIAGPALAQGIKITEDKPGLLKQARITTEAATATALAKVPGGKLRSGEIEHEDGRLIYSLIIKVDGKKGVEEVNVDAMTGAIVNVEHEADPLEPKATKPAQKKP
jgi:uncharacterized membrane protein YkoI